MSTRKVGIIAEDMSDVDSVKQLISRMSQKQIRYEQFVGKGCGKLIHKCSQWSTLLFNQQCTRLLILHDSDGKDPEQLYNKIQHKLSACPFSKLLICIPVQELEAWLLSDPECLKLVFGLSRVPKVHKNPENINSPKECLEDIVWKYSNKRRHYLNTQDNPKIAKVISIGKISTKCQSFQSFKDFVENII